MVNLILVAATAAALADGSIRRPANPVNVTFYNLRPHNLSTDIIEKDSVSLRV